MVKDILFYSLLGSDVFLLISVIISLLCPDKRMYPPPEQNSWQNYSFLFFHHLALFGFFILGAFDWNTFLFRHLAWKIAGGIVFAAGLFFAFWAVFFLTFRRSAGYDVLLISSGPYRFTRNPQIIGSAIAYVGFILMCNSLLALFVGILANIYVFLTIPLEERIFREKFGNEYEAYCRKVRRFV